GAVTVTNPWEVVKIRLQLQGEVASHSGKPYPNAVSAFRQIFVTEGIRGLQKGLAPAYGYQCVVNGIRLGFYDSIKAAYLEGIEAVAGKNAGNQVPAAILAGASAGVLGAFLASPLFLVKT
ncbi:mitochondrial carrier domain-containing protein, partial [Blyttiomyces helicus]